MKNRERLSSMCMYDLLMMMERNIDNIYDEAFNSDSCGRGALCVLECLIGRDGTDVFCKEQTSCADCIQTWLNKEEDYL